MVKLTFEVTVTVGTVSNSYDVVKYAEIEQVFSKYYLHDLVNTISEKYDNGFQSCKLSKVELFVKAGDIDCVKELL